MQKGTIELSDALRSQIRESLKPLQPEKVIVFGSYAHGVEKCLKAVAEERAGTVPRVHDLRRL